MEICESSYKYINSCTLGTGIEGCEYLLNLMKLFVLCFGFCWDSDLTGCYWGKVFSRPEKTSIYYKQTVKEVISLDEVNRNSDHYFFFMGAVITLQTAYNTENPIYPRPMR